MAKITTFLRFLAHWPGWPASQKPPLAPVMIFKRGCIQVAQQSWIFDLWPKSTNSSNIMRIRAKKQHCLPNRSHSHSRIQIWGIQDPFSKALIAIPRDWLRIPLKNRIPSSVLGWPPHNQMVWRPLNFLQMKATLHQNLPTEARLKWQGLPLSLLTSKLSTFYSLLISSDSIRCRKAENML